MKKFVLFLAILICFSSILSSCNENISVITYDEDTTKPSENEVEIFPVEFYVSTYAKYIFEDENGVEHLYQIPKISNISTDKTLNDNICSTINSSIIEEFDETFLAVENELKDNWVVPQITPITYDAYIYNDILTVIPYMNSSIGSYSQVYSIDLKNEKIIDNSYFMEILGIDEFNFYAHIYNSVMSNFYKEFPKEDYIGTDKEEFYNEQELFEWSGQETLFYAEDGTIMINSKLGEFNDVKHDENYIKPLSIYDYAYIDVVIDHTSPTGTTYLFRGYEDEILLRTSYIPQTVIKEYNFNFELVIG